MFSSIVDHALVLSDPIDHKPDHQDAEYWAESNDLWGQKPTGKFKESTGEIGVPVLIHPGDY
jgi:hypothetical protein